jgi:hypothetical protein
MSPDDGTDDTLAPGQAAATSAPATRIRAGAKDDKGTYDQGASSPAVSSDRQLTFIARPDTP